MPSEQFTSRRSLLRVTCASISGLAALAGCLDADENDDPEPHVVTVEADGDLEESTETQTVTATVLVHNVDGSGAVAITVEAVSQYDQVLESVTREVRMDPQEQTEYELDVEVPAAAIGLRATAEPA